MTTSIETAKGTAKQARPRVWVVDDSALEAELTRRPLAARFDVEVFVDGPALLEQLSSTIAPDVIVLDWQMPGLSGIEICQFLRAQPSLQSIAVLIMTVQRETRAIVDALGAGADDFLAKPYVPAELVARVSALVRAKELRDDLLRAEQAVRSVLEHLPDAVVCVDRRGCITFINLEARRVFETDANLVGRPIRDIVPASISGALAHATTEPSSLSDVTIGGRIFSPAIRNYDKIGAPEIVVSLRDVTIERRYDEERSRLLAAERHARSEAQIANRAKDEFLAVVSHELRTPLNAMLGWTRMLRNGAIRSEEKKVRALETIERNANAQAQLIEDILDVSRIITGKFSLALAPVTLSQLVELAMETARPAATAKKLELESDLDPSVGAVTGDHDRLQQVVWNLVSNAVKFSKPGGRVKIALRRVDADTVEMEVADDGEGIDAAFLPHIFERFRQAEAATTRVHGGLGLGLAIVRHIVEMHGGTVSAASDGVGRGSTFRVRLLEKAPPSSVEPSLASVGRVASVATPLSNAPDLAGTKVLVVEDDDDTRELIVIMLRELGADVEGSSETTTGLTKLRAWRPDVLLSDIGMPHEDGYAFIAKVRALAAEDGGGTPAIALTAYARGQDRTAALSAGFDSYMTKPVDPIDLGIVVGGMLGRRAKA